MGFANLDHDRLARFKTLGFNPSCIFDIGASNGAWSWSIRDIYPEAIYHLFEPLADIHPPYADSLENIKKSGLSATVHATAVGAESGSTTIGIDKEVVGSSILIQKTSETFHTLASVPITTIDDIVSSQNLPIPQLIKVDVQGGELAVLQGAVETLKKVEVLLLETWFVRGYGPKTPLFMEVTNWLAKHQFFLLDIGDSYRNENGVLEAPDFFFVRQPSTVSAFNADREYQVNGD